MTPAGSDYGTWCAACRHMIVKDGRRYVHASDDDWASSRIETGLIWGECRCVNALLECKPPELSMTERLSYQMAKAAAGLAGTP